MTVYVPRPLKTRLGKKLTKSLKTDSLREAQSSRWAYVAAFNRAVREAENGKPTTSRDEDARLYRDVINSVRQYGYADIEAGEHPTRLDQEMDALDALVDRIAEAEGDEQALHFRRMATGETTPIRAYVDRWMRATEYTPRTQTEHRTAIDRLVNWTSQTGGPADLERFTGKDAANFRDNELIARRGLARKTTNKILSSLRSYWGWMIDSHLVEVQNPWARKSLGKSRRGAVDEEERAFTTDELVRLFSAGPDEDLHDFMCIAALTGMRIEEIASLTVGQCADGVFRVGDAKTAAGAGRLIPIHSALRGVVDRRSSRKGPRDYLLLDGMSDWKDERSKAMSKRFTRYRRSCGVDHVLAGRRRSLVNFHSFRRWFSEQALQASAAGVGAEVFTWTLVDVMGHQGESLPFGLTMRKYPGPSKMERRRELVESIRLPVVPAVSFRPRRSGGRPLIKGAAAT